MSLTDTSYTNVSCELEKQDTKWEDNQLKCLFLVWIFEFFLNVFPNKLHQATDRTEQSQSVLVSAPFQHV